MREFTFIMNASVTVLAESEADARVILDKETSRVDEDVHVGALGVYIPPGQGQLAELADTYEAH